ncbi:MAG TPA: hypothetical protein VF045_06215, partial [Acidimicrobiales bacterium]
MNVLWPRVLPLLAKVQVLGRLIRARHEERASAPPMADSAAEAASPPGSAFPPAPPARLAPSSHLLFALP